MSLERINDLLDDRYDVVKRLATGGVGDVFLVRHRHLQEFRVIKVLRANLAADEAAMKRFQQEARVATQIKHPNVATLYDYSRLPDGRYYMVWEHIDGQDLGTVIRERGPLPAEVAIELAIQALQGLDAMHTAGVIHRDVSPDNLMLTTDPRGRHLIKVIDLGLVKDLREDGEMDLTQAGTFLGKFQYCSPEQASAEDLPLDARTDLYSLTQVFYEMLTGEPPFESESQHGFVIKRLTEAPIPLRDRSPEIRLPAALEAVVMKGLARERDDRFPDAVTYVKALSRVAEEVRGIGTIEADASGNPAPEPDPPEIPLPDPRPDMASSSPGRRSVEMSREEKLELLAQIDRAASRSQRAKRLDAEAKRALEEDRFDEASSLVADLEAADPRFPGLAEMKRRLADNASTERRRQQVVQTEQMLEKYVIERQQTLAGLALETLLDLYPNHPKRSDYESWVALLGDEAAQQKKAEEAASKGREALARGDARAARTSLEAVETLDLSGKLASALENEIQEAERSLEAGARIEESKRRLEADLRNGELESARRELDRLAGLGVARVTFDGFASRLRTQEIEARYREAVSRHDWYAAREVVEEMQAAFPSSPRSEQMFSEIARLQDIAQKQRALEEGLAAFQRYVDAGQSDQAAVALKVLLQIAPDDPRVQEARRNV